MDEEENDNDDFRKLEQLDIRKPYQLSYWAEELNVSRQWLKLAWYEVGPDIKKIREYMKQKK